MAHDRRERWLGLAAAAWAMSVAIAAAAAPATAQGDTPDSQALAVLSAAKAATGGAAWDRITGWHERGRHGGATYDTLLDFRRYAFRFATTLDGVTRVHGFNGEVVWDTAPEGKFTTSRGEEDLADARQSAYGSIFGFFMPDRFPARFEYLGVQADEGASFDVVKITPTGAAPVEVWVDRSTHLPARFVDRSGPKPVTARLSDYRQVGGVREPFRIEVSDGDPAHAQAGLEVESVELETVTPSQFDPPA